jgi:RNA polymerase sigma-70 factor (ECF subfamily)
MFSRRRNTKAEFEREVMPHLQALHSVALRLTRSEGDAEDLVQDAVLRAYRFWDGFEAGSNCKAWLLRILTNVFRNRYRERNREQEILLEAESTAANLGQFQGQPLRDAESALFGRMLSRDVEKALEALPNEFRIPVVLADLEDLSYKEIADIMECPAGTVMSRLYRGRRMLQKLLMAYVAETDAPPSEAAPAPDSTLVNLDEFRRLKREGGAS